jgi:CO/xanthine dehydrogenase FAD-binding subunit
LNIATVGGNLCMSLPAGAMISLTAALAGVCTIWQRDGGERRVPVVDFVTGDHQNVLAPGELLRSIDVPAAALQQRTSFRRMSLTHEGRSSVLLIGTLCPRQGTFALTVTAATIRPVRIGFAQVPASDSLSRRLREGIPDALYLDDPHGTPAHRKHLTFYFAEEIRRELSAANSRPETAHELSRQRSDLRTAAAPRPVPADLPARPGLVRRQEGV